MLGKEDQSHPDVLAAGRVRTTAAHDGKKRPDSVGERHAKKRAPRTLSALEKRAFFFVTRRLSTRSRPSARIVDGRRSRRRINKSASVATPRTLVPLSALRETGAC